MTTYTPEQQREHRRLWVEALRSGKYQQARGQLKKRGGMCCLGVACDLSKLGAWQEEAYVGPHFDRYDALPEAVRDWLGLGSFTGYLGNGESLASKNDDGRTFAQLADIIESEPPGLIAKVEAKP